MKKIPWSIIALVVVVATTFTSCKKYPDGPTISLRSKAARVANTWKVEKYLLNVTDQTAAFNAFASSFTETYTKDGVYSYTYGSNTGSGKWEFQNKEMEIKVSGVNGASSETLVILKLKESEFWYYSMDGNDKSEYHMIPN